MALENWTDEQKDWFCIHRANNHTVQETIEAFWKEFPDAGHHTDSTIRSWFRTEEGKKKYHLALESVRGQAREREYANKESRILALVEMGNKIHLALRDMDPKVDKFQRVFKSFLDCLAALRQETEDGIENAVVLSAFESFYKGMKQSPFAWALKKHLPQTPETPSN